MKKGHIFLHSIFTDHCEGTTASTSNPSRGSQSSKKMTDKEILGQDLRWVSQKKGKDTMSPHYSKPFGVKRSPYGTQLSKQETLLLTQIFKTLLSSFLLP